ncbi:protein of unknown function [Clostridium beijerinckii]|nr:protein of unknown function [Clostridium beijerinckii]
MDVCLTDSHKIIDFDSPLMET